MHISGCAPQIRHKNATDNNEVTPWPIEKHNVLRTCRQRERKINKPQTGMAQRYLHSIRQQTENNSKYDQGSS